MRFNSVKVRERLSSFLLCTRFAGYSKVTMLAIQAAAQKEDCRAPKASKARGPQRSPTIYPKHFQGSDDRTRPPNQVWAQSCKGHYADGLLCHTELLTALGPVKGAFFKP